MGHTIPGGMLYVGSRALAGDGHSVEPALIDPSLPVQWKRPDPTGESLGYWPTYQGATASARAAYLQWLVEGRSGPNAGIGYVFLYFYGLERRFLVDLAASGEHPEARLIGDEVRRLLGIYGANRSFESYATGFLDLLDTSTARTSQLTPPDWTSFPQTWEVPAVVRVALGRYVSAGQPIPANWALLLLRLHPEAYLRTPATRCQSEFDELFRARYRNKFGDGLIVQPPKRRVEVSYRPASGGLRNAYRILLDDIPDICSIATPINKLRHLAADCTDSLDAYSRFLGRNPDAVNGPAAIALLPDELLESHGGSVLESLRGWVRLTTTDGARAVPFDDVVERWSPGRKSKLTKKDAVVLAGLLGKVGAGIEPDVRFGGKTPAPGSAVVLFPLPADAPTSPSPQYAASSVLVHLTAVVAASDGAVGDDERRHLAEHLETSLGLNDAECARLEAHLRWLTEDKPSLAGVKRRLDALDARQRSTIGQYLVGLAAADGNVSPEEITTLTKLYKMLGLEEGDVYSAVHSLETDSGPVTVRPADPTVPRHTIPAAEDSQRPAVQLDPAKVQARLAETATVTALLTDIFSDEEEPAATPAPTAPPIPAQPAGTVDIDGLDGPHAGLADRLRQQPAWSRADAEDVAAELGLPLLDGALDRINEAAMDICGEPLVEGDDPIEINDYAEEELFT